MSILSEGIKMWREFYGLSQAELAANIGVLQHHISRWESGKTIPSKDSLDKLCAALGVDCKIYLTKKKDIDGEADEKAFRQFFCLPQDQQLLIYLLIEALFNNLKHE